MSTEEEPEIKYDAILRHWRTQPRPNGNFILIGQIFDDKSEVHKDGSFIYSDVIIVLNEELTYARTISKFYKLENQAKLV